MTSHQLLTIDSLVTQIYETEEKLSLGAAKIGQEYLEKLLQKSG